MNRLLSTVGVALLLIALISGALPPVEVAALGVLLACTIIIDAVPSAGRRTA